MILFERKEFLTVLDRNLIKNYLSILYEVEKFYSKVIYFIHVHLHIFLFLSFFHIDNM